MRRLFVLLFRVAVTLAMVATAGVVGLALWDYYWTRRGRATGGCGRTSSPIAPDVSGLVTEVLVSDNQNVRRGDVLFRIDPERFTLALRQAEAVVAGKSAAAVQSEKDYERYKQLSDAAVSQQTVRAGAGDRAGGEGRLRSGGRRPRPRQAQPRALRGARVGQRPDHQHGPAARRLRHRRPRCDGADRRGHAARRGLFRGDQAAAHPRERQGDGPAARATRPRCRAASRASPAGSRTGSAAPARTCSRTSIRPSPGSASPSGFRCASCSTRCRTA